MYFYMMIIVPKSAFRQDATSSCAYPIRNVVEQVTAEIWSMDNSIMNWVCEIVLAGKV
jgi:hypothetical protein